MNGINSKQGVYGGTFDPIHKGHLKIIKESILQLGLDVLYVVVSGDSWMKKNNVVASKQQRHKMAEITLNNYAKICLVNIEVSKNSPSYSYQTLEYLKDKNKKADFYFIMGADSAMNMDKWKKPLNILCSSKIVCVPRNNILNHNVKDKLFKIYPKTQVQFLKNIDEKTSSTSIRNLIKRNKSQKEYLNKNVYTYILKNGIYI